MVFYDAERIRSCQLEDGWLAIIENMERFVERGIQQSLVADALQTAEPLN